MPQRLHIDQVLAKSANCHRLFVARLESVKLVSDGDSIKQVSTGAKNASIDHLQNLIYRFPWISMVLIDDLCGNTAGRFYDVWSSSNLLMKPAMLCSGQTVHNVQLCLYFLCRSITRYVMSHYSTNCYVLSRKFKCRLW